MKTRSCRSRFSRWGSGLPTAFLTPSGYERREPALQSTAAAGTLARCASTDEALARREAVHTEGTDDQEGVLEVDGADGRTLVFNDLVFNHPHNDGVQGFVSRYLLGHTGGPKVSRVHSLALARDKPANPAHLRRLAERPAARIVPGHGDVIFDDATETLRRTADRLSPPR